MASAESGRKDTGEQIGRLRRLCLALPETTEKLSHGEPTCFVRRKVFAMFANNHHDDGHIAVWIPVPPGAQATLIHTWPDTFFRPPYVGVKGWVGVELERISDDELAGYLLEAWRLIAPKKLTSLLE
ncbi:MAG TPA: MmcQ/YjbR family DNA-binding protein [Bryobacteraceae bacterium]|nr:MmcQ/YjbR family DNA-binding protein [Bryobacteraceae bacterium]